MRIENTGPTQSVKTSKKVKRVGSDDFEVSETSDEAVSANVVAPIAPLGSVDSVLALQMVDETEQRQQRMERRARQLLNALDQLKLDLLEARDPVNTLINLKALIDGEREATSNDKLEALLDDIELRAEVEIAKLNLK